MSVVCKKCGKPEKCTACEIALSTVGEWKRRFAAADSDRWKFQNQISSQTEEIRRFEHNNAAAIEEAIAIRSKIEALISENEQLVEELKIAKRDAMISAFARKKEQ